MLATGKRAVFPVLAICLVCSTKAYPQSADHFVDSKRPKSDASLGVWVEKCAALPTMRFGGGRPGDGSLEYERGATGDLNVASALDTTCLERTPPTLTENRCRPGVSVGSGAPDISKALRCPETEDRVVAELSAFGKAGMKIARAREEVLDILRGENACSEWFKAKDVKAAATFQSVGFSIDQRGPQEVFETRPGQSVIIFRHPYVARATQDGGPFTEIAVNANGAFFHSRGVVERVHQEGGALQLDGTRELTVGSYAGDTLPAQMVTLLHELGHIIDLLPEDTDDLDGRSGRNTDDVLRHCRAEVETRARQAKQTAKR